jgi:ketosteroid isomerase-like protein
VFEGMKVTLILGMAACALATSLTACGGSDGSSEATATQQKDADKYAIEQIESNWHKAASTQDVDLMMSLWADDATFNNGADTYVGKQQIRDFFTTKAGPFQPGNHWISETPAYKIRVTVNGDKGTLYFECHYVDVKTGKVVSVVGADQNVQKIDNKWVITSLAAATPTLSP